MKLAKLTEKPAAQRTLVTGLFTRREAAQQIIQGSRHLHSSKFGNRDLCARTTKSSLKQDVAPQYPWEQTTCLSVSIASSAARSNLIQKIVTDLGIEKRRGMRESVQLVAEELITNGIYHAYFEQGGNEKYERNRKIDLPDTERLGIQYAATHEGVYLSVTDQGGALEFEHIIKAFMRCYSKGQPEIESKVSGAGLGIYLIFEHVTHLKIVVTQSQTIISCWIAEKKFFDPDYFSFNFFSTR